MLSHTWKMIILMSVIIFILIVISTQFIYASSCLVGCNSCATIMLNKRGLPENVSKTKLKREGELVEYQKGESLLSVVFHKRQISFLSSGQSIGKMAPPHETHACVNYSYNRHMGGVDLGNQNASYYPVGRSGNKWWQYIFWWGINVAIVNFYVI